MARVILGTAGHIDHGKTALVRALTGVDTDRLKEEKARGITIELGFAELQGAGELSLGVVDVPGHEAFVRTMVAGATGMDVVLLVVAADEGVMPQTREHLSIIELLAIRELVVADASEADIKEAALAEGMTTLAQDGFEKVCQGVTSIAELMRVALTDESLPTYCHSCQTVLSPDFIACPECGTKVFDSCPSCDHKVNSGWQYCAYCSRPMKESSTFFKSA